MDFIGPGWVEEGPWDMGLSLLKLRRSQAYRVELVTYNTLYITIITTIVNVVSNVLYYIQFKSSQFYARAIGSYFRKKINL